MRLLIGIPCGLLTAFLWLALVQGVGIWLYPPPEGLDPSRSEDIIKIAAATPVGAQFFVVASWFIATLSGGVVANAISREWWPALVIAMVIIAIAALTMLTIPHPIWMQIAGAAAPLIAAELANRLVRR